MIEIISSAIILALLGGVVALIIRGIIKNKKSGKSGCGCGCSGCAMNGSCHSAINELD